LEVLVTNLRWYTIFFLLVIAAHAQEGKFFPTKDIGGEFEFEFAAPHNEWDLNRCAVNAGAPYNGGAGAPCTAFARGALGARVEFKPVNIGPFSHLYVFMSPRTYFGDNLPQVRYTMSFEAIGMERTDGLIYVLPRGFEAVLTQHAKMYWFGKYQHNLGAADLGNSPYGQYNSIGVHWRFGTFRSTRSAE
jgi:hypothetical protein